MLNDLAQAIYHEFPEIIALYHSELSEALEEYRNNKPFYYEPEILEYNSSKIRVIDKDGEPWFVAKDVCMAFELKSPAYEIAKLDEDEKCTCKIQTNGGIQTSNIVSASGLLFLLLRSKMPVAKHLSRRIGSKILLNIMIGDDFDDTGANSVNDSKLQEMSSSL